MSQSSFQQSIAAVAQAPGQFYQTAKANGLMKRNSIFSRPGSRNGAPVDLDTIDLDPSRSTHRSVSTCEPSSRPSLSTGAMERSHTDPTLGKRSSLFGRRKRSSRKSGRDEDVSDTENAPKYFESDEDCTLLVNCRKESWRSETNVLQDQSHIRKQTISQPFNFQHLSSTRRRHVPGLPTVNEKGQIQIPTNSIPAGAVSSRPTTPCLPQPGSGPQHSVSRSVDVTQGRPPMLATGGRPRAASYQTGPGVQRSPSSMSQVVRLSMNNPNIPTDSEAIPPVAAQTQHRSPSEVKYRAQQPLPALPQRAASKRESKRMTLDSQLSCSSSGETSSIPDSRRSSQHARSTNAGPWSPPNERMSMMEFCEESWEEYVDFCYEQEAESTCNFHWDETDEDVDGVLRLSKFLPPSNGSRRSTVLVPTSANTTSPTQRRRFSIVGHRGFQYARSTSTIPEGPDHETCDQSTQEELVRGKDVIFGPEISTLSTSVGSISDNASSTGSSGHKKSSSCASYESGIRLPAPSSDNGHSSIASLNSVPELTHSDTARSSAEAVVLPEPAFVPHSARLMPACDIMRKPSTLSNRAILQAGRVVQRGRGASIGTSRMSRIPSEKSQRPLLEGEEAASWI